MSFPPDVIRYLSTYLSAIDVLHVGMTCKSLAHCIIENQKLWRYYVTQRFSDVHTAGIGENDVEWKIYAFSASSDIVKKKLQMFHLKKRLGADPQSPDYLRLFCSITTPGDDTCILGVQGEIELGPSSDERPRQRHFTDVRSAVAWMDAPEGAIRVTFAHHRASSVLFWCGEKGKESKLRVYAVDRRRTSNQADLQPSSTHPKQTILSKSQYSHIGKVAYQDVNFFADVGGSVSYNYSSDHSRFRDMGATSSRTGFGSNSTSFDKPFVAVEAWVNVTCTFEISDLFELFCTVDQK